MERAGRVNRFIAALKLDRTESEYDAAESEIHQSCFVESEIQ